MDNYYSSFMSFPDQEWIYARPVEFTVDTLRDRQADGSLVVAVRHGNDFPYSNIWLEMRYRDIAAREHVDTFNIGLADAFGHWYGRGSGPSVLRTDTVKPHFGIYRGMKIRLRQIMRVDTLTNIEQVGIVFSQEK